MLQNFSQSQNWLFSEPLFFDEEIYESMGLMDFQSLPTPPQSPPMKAGAAGTNPLSKEDQLSYVSNILLEDQDMQFNWTCDFFKPEGKEKDELSDPCSPEEDSSEECLWQCLAADRTLEEKLVLGSSPLLPEMNTGIFEGMADSMLDCQSLMNTQEQPSEATSDYGSTGGELSTYSSSDSEEEIDVVTVVRCPSSPCPLPSTADLRIHRLKLDEEQRALERHNIEIQLQHNYAAPRPASPPPSNVCSKRPRGGDGSSRSCASVRSSAALSSRSLHHSLRNSMETEDEEERRRTHNVMERQRRNELKNCFTRLRDIVPELCHNDKASKVVILKKARDYIYGLEDEAHILETKRNKLRVKQQDLKAKLEHLRLL